jgi:hypothetical protein
MSERRGSPYDSTAHKWLALIERRQQSFIELWHSGRWQHYYTHAEFNDQMREVLDLRNRWAVLAGVPMTDQIMIRQNIKEGGATAGRHGLGQHGSSAVLLAAVPAPL